MLKSVYICITELLCCTAEINTTLSIDNTSIKKNFLKKNPHLRMVFIALESLLLAK